MIYVNARTWTRDPQYSEPIYDQAEHFLQFIDKYASPAVGNHVILQWSKSNRTKTFLDNVLALNIAHTILVYKNTKVVWEVDLKIKASSKVDKKRHHATRHRKTKYHEGRGKHLKRYSDGWMDNGQEYYQELPSIFKDLKSSDVWKTLHHWKLYQKKHYDKGDNQDEKSKAQNEECDKSNKDNWKIDVNGRWQRE
jgi:hypothetical protein